MNLEQLWQAVLGEIEVNVSKPNFTTWFKSTFINSYDEGNVIVCVPNIFTKAWLEKKYNQAIISALKNITKEDSIKIIYKIETRKPSAIPTANKTQARPLAPVLRLNNLNKFGLNSKYTFNSFIVGKNNDLAHAAAQAVTANPGHAYNPLVIYGGVGLGKTHLLQAIGNELAKKTDKILYATSERFSNDYINEVRGGRAKFLKEKYRSIDLLLIDDIQFMGGKDGTQEEFFHTFNELHQANKQIVVTCDRPLKTIPALENRLLSRLEWGMVADIGKPDLETRIAILQNKCQEKSCPLNNKILEYIASNIESNVRELEGILIKLITYLEFNNITPTLDAAKSILADSIISFQHNILNTEGIIDVISKFYNINNKDMLGKSRKKELVLPRQIVMYLLRAEISLSFPAIGHAIGGRDHSTVMHACNKIENEIEKNGKTAQEINSIKQLIQNC
ncbi:MAG: chromosomal replication initiator protein DnaA [bacterium]